MSHNQHQFELSRFFNLSLDLCAVATLDGYFKLVNPRFTEVLGYSESELKANPFLSFVHPDDVAATLEEMSQLEKGINTLHFKNRYRTKKGSFVWLSWNARALPEEGLIYSIARDVTHLEDLTSTTQWQQRWLKRAEHMAGVGHWRVSADFQELFWSDEIYRIHGVDPETFTPNISNGIEAYHPDDREGVSNHIQHTLQTGEPFEFRFRLLRPNGEERLVWSRGERLDDTNGTPLALFGVFMDVTEVELLKETLSITELRYQNLYNQTPAMLHSIDSNGRLVEVSDYWLQELGYERDEVLGRPPSDFLCPESQRKAERVIAEFLKAGSCSNISYRFVRKDGSQFDVLLSAIAERDADGKILRSMAVSKNITARLTAQRKLESSYRELEDLALAASHDLKAPVRNIRMFSKLVAEEVEDDQKAAEYLGFVSEAGDRLDQVLKALVSYLTLNIKPVHFGPVELNKVVEKVRRGLSSSISESGGTIEVGSLPTVYGDEVQLYSLFENVLSNALKFRSDAPPMVKIESVDDPEFWWVQVQDNGIGISPADRTSVFGLFKRLRGEFPGTGMGLSVAKKIVELHEGKIHLVDCEVGACLRFSLKKELSH